MYNQEYYDTFIEKTKYLSVMQTEGVFEIAPNISKVTGNLILSLFHLDKDEGILLIRKNINETYFVITTVGLYHNLGGTSFSLKWDNITYADGGVREYNFYRNKRLLFTCSPDIVLFGYAINSSQRYKFLSLLRAFPRYKFTPSPEASRISETFRDAMSSLPQYMTSFDSYLDEKFAYDNYQIPETETILHHRSPYLLSGISFLVTDNALYYRDENISGKSFRICWNSIDSVGREGEEVCFYDKRGNKVGLPINHVIKRRKGLFEKEELFFKDIDKVVEAFSKVLKAVKRTSDTFVRSFANYPKCDSHDTFDYSNQDPLYKPRCPFCGSDSYELTKTYYKKDRKAHTMHDLQDLATSAVAVALGGKPSRSSYESEVRPEYICRDCHNIWEMDWMEKE